MILLAFNHSCPVHAPFLRFYPCLRTVCAFLCNKKSTQEGALFVGGRMMPRGTPRELLMRLKTNETKDNSPYERSEVVVTNPPSPTNKKGTFVYQKFSFCLSKPQAWYIIIARSVVYIISPCGAVYHHAPACILLRLDDIQGFFQ